MDVAANLVKYSPPESRKNQLKDVAEILVRAAGYFDQPRFANIILSFVGAPSPAHAFHLEDKSAVLREAIFTSREYYHTLYDPDGKRDVSFPAGYDALRRITKAIHEDRSKKAIPPVSTVSSSKGTRKSTRGRSQGEPESEDEDEGTVRAPSPALTTVGADEAPPTGPKAKSALAGKKGVRAHSPAPAKKGKGNKRARIDSVPFHEDSFLTHATAEVYASAPLQVRRRRGPASVVEMGTEFMRNHLALRKRMYFIMVELAVIHENLRSSLARREQLLDEGEKISARLREFPRVLLCRRRRSCSLTRPQGASPGGSPFLQNTRYWLNRFGHLTAHPSAGRHTLPGTSNPVSNCNVDIVAVIHDFRAAAFVAERVFRLKGSGSSVSGSSSSSSSSGKASC
ncbi:hypothetical protein R3P38DRAFT_2763132 [Favolaschia claudopus]|uniref:Uncharacterized protein n=1 Tax=Favolaschia claudopus TaxID=2862362 RepID=A0AAW0DM75_9AGAR